MEEYIMLRIGIIGAGTISVSHITAYSANPDCEIVAIADLNTELAGKRAKDYNIPTVVSDYHEILNDKTIDAVSVAVPTFLHKKVTIEALESGKHVFCEKPPALNADEVKVCAEASKKSGKLLMYGFVVRFKEQARYLKKYIDSGKMGKIVSVEIERTSRCGYTGGWFMNKEKSGGGVFFDGLIHELDLMMYVMGYPKVRSVTANVSYLNRDLPQKMKGTKSNWYSSDTVQHENTTETAVNAYIMLENGVSIIAKAGHVVIAPQTGTFAQICGEKAGVRFNTFGNVEIVEVGDDNYLYEVTPVIEGGGMYNAEIDHFVDCILNGTECICKPEQAAALMEIVDAAYKSGETGKTVYFE